MYAAQPIHHPRPVVAVPKGLPPMILTSKRRSLAFLGALTIGAAISCSAAPANATPGSYTYGGNVRITVATAGGCATATWPKGFTSTECGVYQVVQGPVTPGDRFGVSITSYSGAAVSCRITDVTTGDLIFSDVASSGYMADCIRRAVR